MKTSDLKLVNEALATIKETDAFDFAEKEANRFLTESIQILDEIDHTVLSITPG